MSEQEKKGWFRKAVDEYNKFCSEQLISLTNPPYFSIIICIKKQGYLTLFLLFFEWF